MRDAYHAPVAALVKGATTLPSDTFAEAAGAAWQLLLEPERELSACAAALFALAAVRAPPHAAHVMQRALKSTDPAQRYVVVILY